MAFNVSIVNLRTQQSLLAQYNPEGFSERVQALFGEARVVGYSHEPLQYEGTSNLKLEGLEFRFDARSPKRGYTRLDVENARRFFLATQYADQADSIAKGQPDRMLFVWPKLYTLTCHLILDENMLEEFNTDGSIRRFRARFSLTKIADVRILPTDDDIRPLESL